MKFPISRERLQKYMPNQTDYIQIQRSIYMEMKQIRTNVEKTILTTNERKYVYKGAWGFKHFQTQNIFHAGTGNSGRVYNCLNELLEAIKTTFPEFTITMDPLETYIIIDWS